ncbi:MAG: energy-coupling factor ABC transporter permease [Spirochaetales bacterium]|nr:energy-coupling factor ABC transporter permease [Spirochaetales bacterium]
MHMADALISPVVGAAMLASGAGLAAYSGVKLKNEMDEKKIPLMGVMGAFIFAAQMINFSIPATGSSGHLGGGLILAAILGPYAGFLSMAVILLIQALVFADGGLLAYGCNVVNLAFFTSFIVFPFIYKPILGKSQKPGRIMAASIIGAVAGLQMGSFAVVLETFFSGKTELPFGTFLLLMQPIHLAIGIIEGIVTGFILTFVMSARPDILQSAGESKPLKAGSVTKIIVSFSVAAVIIGGFVSWFASSFPDGLEWSMANTSGQEELDSPGGIHDSASGIQEKTAFLPDYGFKTNTMNAGEPEEPAAESWPSPSLGTTVSGLAGGALVFGLAALIALVIWMAKRMSNGAFDKSKSGRS